MTKKSDVNYTVSLKHRLIGAGILISFGVIILPWLLGSYSSEQVVEKSEPLSQKNTIIESEKASSLKVAKDSEPKSEVKIFVSRVQPLTNTPDNSAPKQVVKESPKVVVKTDKKVKTTTSSKTLKAEPKSTLNVNATPQAVPKTGQTKVDRGYIVSVGVFGDTKNVDKMLSDLRLKKFKPLVREEKFKNKTVSRIYMGPFATRAEAGKVKLKLSEKENIPSLIKEFP